jgi:hypothetical protein
MFQTPFLETQQELESIGFFPGTLLKINTVKYFWIRQDTPIVMERIGRTSGYPTSYILREGKSKKSYTKVVANEYLLFLGLVPVEVVEFSEKEKGGSFEKIVKEIRVLQFLHGKHVLWWPALLSEKENSVQELLDTFENVCEKGKLNRSTQ